MSGADAIRARFALRHPRAARAALDVDLALPGRGVTAIFGPSGAGKTSLLRCIAGLERVPGELLVHGQVWQDAHRRLPAHRRPLGYVFQEASLFAHLTARGNLRYAARRAGAEPDQWDRVVSLMDLAPLLERFPQQLSGGERQRVAIGRALLIRPRLLLMDEPMAALDAARKREILPYLERLHAALDMPVLYVSHSLDEVARLADHVLVLHEGQAVAQGETAAILPRLQAPAGEEAGVMIEAEVAGRDEHWKLARLAFAGGELWVADGGEPIGQTLRVRVLARDVSLSRDARTASSILNRPLARVVAIEEDAAAAQALVRLAIGDAAVLARITRRSVAELALRPGDCVHAQIKSVAVIR